MPQVLCGGDPLKFRLMRRLRPRRAHCGLRRVTEIIGFFDLALFCSGVARSPHCAERNAGPPPPDIAEPVLGLAKGETGGGALSGLRIIVRATSIPWDHWSFSPSFVLPGRRRPLAPSYQRHQALPPVEPAGDIELEEGGPHAGRRSARQADE